MTHSTHVHSDYLGKIFESPTSFRNTVNRTVKALKKKNKEEPFEYIVCRGVSGMVVASPVSLILKKRLIVVRKPKEDCHASKKIEGIPDIENMKGASFKYVIIDDFVFLGSTRNILYNAMTKFNGHYVGLYQYNYDEWFRG